MNRHYRIEAGAIVDGPIDLPKSWRNISGLNLMAADSLAEYGWLPEKLVSYDYDHTRQNRTGPDLVIEAKRVVATYTVTDKAPEELVARAKKVAVGELRQMNVETARLVQRLVRVLVAKNVIKLTDLTDDEKSCFDDIKTIADVLE